jgi:hypothetical protein
LEAIFREKRMNHLNRWISLGLVLVLGFLLGVLGYSLWDKPYAPIGRINWSPEVQWISPQQESYNLYARRTFYLPDAPQVGWLRLSADDNFFLFVNGQRVAYEYSVTTNHPLSFNSRLSEKFQRFNDITPYVAANRSYIFIAPPRGWKLTTYVDITSYLRAGKNVIGLEIRKGQKNPRAVVEGYVYSTPQSTPISLSTGLTPWRTSMISNNHQALQWYSPDFPDESWSEAKSIGLVQEATYSRLSKNLFERPLHGSWINGTASPQGELRLRGAWQVPKGRKRAFIRFAGGGNYSLLINGLLVNNYRDNNANQLHLHEVTNFLQDGMNTLAVRLAPPLETVQAFEGFFLDGWVETNQGNAIAQIATDSSWLTLSELVDGWYEGEGQGRPASVLAPPKPQEFKRVFEGDAYLLNFPEYLLHNLLWCLLGVFTAFILSLGMGRFFASPKDSLWNIFGGGAALLMPSTFFLIGIGLLKHRYAESETGLIFAQPQTNSLALFGFVILLMSTLLFACWQKTNIQSKSDASVSSSLPLNPGFSAVILGKEGLFFLFGLIVFIGLQLPTGETYLLAMLLLGGTIGGITGLVIVCHRTNQKLTNLSIKNIYISIKKSWQIWGEWFWLGLIIGIGFILRSYDLGSMNLEWDETISLDATRGIIRTGAPEPTSGIWYTRSPAFHYLLAFWLRMVGDSVINARFLATLIGTATLVLIYAFTREITGKVWIALVVTAILTVDPFTLWYSRNIRFYQMLQFTTLLSFWLFIKGFVDRKGNHYQCGFFIAVIAMLLSQELNIAVVPCFLIGFLFFYRPFRLTEEWMIVWGGIMVAVIYGFNGIVVLIKSLTPLVAVSDRTVAQVRPHLSNVTWFINVLFVGPGRLNTLYSLFFLLGFIYFVKRRDAKLIFLFSSVLLSLILMTLVSFAINGRYTYGYYPIFIMLSVYSAISLAEVLGRRFELISHKFIHLRLVAVIATVVILVSNLEINRVFSAFQESINPRNGDAFEYVKRYRQLGDIVISNVPPASTLSSVKLDYNVSTYNETAFDNVYLRDGQIVDRGVGSLTLTTPDQIAEVLAKSSRVWLVLEQYRSSRLEPKLSNYLQTLGKSVFEPFGTTLRLWERQDGILPRVPNEGKDLGSY